MYGSCHRSAGITPRYASAARLTIRRISARSSSRQRRTQSSATVRRRRSCAARRAASRRMSAATPMVSSMAEWGRESNRERDASSLGLSDGRDREIVHARRVRPRERDDRPRRDRALLRPLQRPHARAARRARRGARSNRVRSRRSRTRSDGRAAGSRPCSAASAIFAAGSSRGAGPTTSTSRVGRPRAGGRSGWTAPRRAWSGPSRAVSARLARDDARAVQRGITGGEPKSIVNGSCGCNRAPEARDSTCHAVLAASPPSPLP